jgi:hypothetical protein
VLFSTFNLIDAGIVYDFLVDFTTISVFCTLFVFSQLKKLTSKKTSKKIIIKSKTFFIYFLLKNLNHFQKNLYSFVPFFQV